MPRTDRLLALVLAALTVASRLPFRARLLPTWDAVQFALGLREYDLARHQPHPPGSILYVALARAVHALTGDPAASLVWISVAASAVVVFLVYRLAWALHGRATALVAAALVMTSPLFWLHGVIGLPYAPEAALVLAVATLAWRARQGEPRAVYASALTLGLAGGVRQSLLALLFPLWLGMAWAGVRRARVILGGGALLGLATAAWLVPMLALVGGPGPYLEVSRELYESTVHATALWGPRGGWRANLRGLGEAVLMTLGLFLPALVVGLARAAPHRGRWGPREWFLAAWLAPPLAVYVALHFGQHAYLLAVLPALAILAAHGLVSGIPGRTRATVAVGAFTTVGCLAHAVLFVAAGPVDVLEAPSEAPWSARLAADLKALYRYRLWTATARGLAEQEHVVESYVGAVRRAFDPADTVLVTELGNPRSYPWYRHARYYLPEFTVYHLRLGRFSPGYLTSARPQSMAARAGPEVSLPASARRLVWVVDHWSPALPRPPGLEERPLAHGRWLYVLALDEHPVEHGGYRLRRAAGPRLRG